MAGSFLGGIFHPYNNKVNININFCGSESPTEYMENLIIKQMLTVFYILPSQSARNVSSIVK